MAKLGQESAEFRALVGFTVGRGDRAEERGVNDLSFEASQERRVSRRGEVQCVVAGLPVHGGSTEAIRSFIREGHWSRPTADDHAELEPSELSLSRCSPTVSDASISSARGRGFA